MRPDLANRPAKGGGERIVLGQAAGRFSHARRELKQVVQRCGGDGDVALGGGGHALQYCTIHRLSTTTMWHAVVRSAL